MHINCYQHFQAYSQNCDIAIRFSDRDFLKESNNFVISRRLSGVSIAVQIAICHNNFYFWSIWSNDAEHVWHVALSTGIILPSLKSVNIFVPLTFLLLIRYAMLWPWRFTVRPWTT